MGEGIRHDEQQILVCTGARVPGRSVWIEHCVIQRQEQSGARRAKEFFMTVKAVCRVAMIVGSTVTLAAVAPPRDVVVTSMILDYAADIAPRLEVQSDGQGNYVNAKTLVSIIQAIGDWELDARNPKGATRTIHLDFTRPVPGSAPGGADPAGLPSGSYKFRIIAKCTLYGNSLLAFAPGVTKPCPLHVGFETNGVRYALQMDPYTAPNGPFPETNYANVTCIFPTTGTAPCTQWKFTPSGTYLAPDNSVRYQNVAKLLQYDAGGNIEADRGDFYVSFSMIVAK
jgi:hypothetical protein